MSVSAILQPYAKQQKVFQAAEARTNQSSEANWRLLNISPKLRTTQKPHANRDSTGGHGVTLKARPKEALKRSVVPVKHFLKCRALFGRSGGLSK